jgi:hypothetical protein
MKLKKQGLAKYEHSIIIQLQAGQNLGLPILDQRITRMKLKSIVLPNANVLHIPWHLRCDNAPLA